jgi:hypothetical protein
MFHLKTAALSPYCLTDDLPRIRTGTAQNREGIKMTAIADVLRDAGSRLVFWLILALVLVIDIVGYLVAHRAGVGSSSIGEAGKVVHDWTPTGRIDFAGPTMDATATDTPASFYLQAEDIRFLVSFSGIERKEVRGRKATLNEAKRVVNIFHRQMPEGSNRPTNITSLPLVSSTHGATENAAKSEG